MLEGRKRRRDCSSKHTTSQSPSRKSKNNSTLDDSTFRSPNDCSIMTRKPIRTRRPRIPILQSGYCAICNLPYNSVEDHIQSKKHQKLIGEDANFIALNGYIHSDVGLESLLSLTGIDAIGFDDFSSPKIRRRNMPRTRASSVMSDIVKPSETIENEPKHRLRSRKNINYMTPPLEDDSFQDKPDLEPVRLEYKEYRELRSSTRALAKLTSIQNTVEQELWESGRPKRACINRSKRISADERLVSDNKTYYKVEVLSNKLRSTDKDKEVNKQQPSKANETDKGLIVKFKKLRNSELIQLNNEATNFLFPKRDESSEEDEEEEAEGVETNETEEEKETTISENNEVSSSSVLEDVKPPDKFKIDEEESMDSISAECKKKKKRRSHAEAFIMDNQKYYKFETPGSRLRYHGSYLSPIPTKSNGDCVTKSEEDKDKELVEKKEKLERLKVNLDEFKFSFETVPENEKWYKTFRRQDRSEQRYNFGHNYYWDDFVMPYRIPHLKPVDPRVCFTAYTEILKGIKERQFHKEPEEMSPDSDTNSYENEFSPQSLEAKDNEDLLIEQIDEDSKLSEISTVSHCDSEEVFEIERRHGGKRKRLSGGGRNPRKSPRQHASTLAILSSLIHQRKRRSRNAPPSEANASLQTIPEETLDEQHKPLITPQKTRKKRVDYLAIATQIEEDFDSALDGDMDLELDLEPTVDPNFISFKESRLKVDDIMTLCKRSKTKESERNNRKIISCPPGRKPGKRKKNRTGWPNKVKRRKVLKEENESVTNLDTDEDEEHGDSDSIIEGDGNHNHKKNECNSDTTDRVVNTSEIRDSKMQPYVYVKKLETIDKSVIKTVVSSTRRTVRRPQRRLITATPKSPRILRRPRGRWYRER